MQVLIRQLKVVTVNNSGVNRIRKAAKEGLCLGCMNLNDQLIRGLCSPCYQATRRLINSGELDEGSLVRDGRILAKSKGGRPATNPVTVESKVAKQAEAG